MQHDAVRPFVERSIYSVRFFEFHLVNTLCAQCSVVSWQTVNVCGVSYNQCSVVISTARWNSDDVNDDVCDQSYFGSHRFGIPKTLTVEHGVAACYSCYCL